MEDAKFIRVTHRNEAHFVALCAGLDPGEVSRLLQAAFQVEQHVVGLMDKADTAISGSEDDQGVVIPLSLACRAPQMLGGGSYSLLLSEREVTWEEAKSRTAWLVPIEGSQLSSAKAVGEGTAGGQQAAGRTLWGTEGGDDESDEQDDEGGGETLEMAGQNRVEADNKERIVAFIRRMAFNGLLTKDDQNTLESSAVAGDAVINAAFAAAMRSQDLDYLSALLKDIAANGRGSPQGMRLLEAKREMLDMVEVLHQANEVDEEQLVYLQNLILVSNKAVTDAFGVYEEDQDPVRLAESLKQLCGAQANTARQAAAPAASSDSDSNDKNVLKVEAEQDAMTATIMKIASNLNNEGLLRAREASVLKEMVLRENPVLMAAFELYREDENAAELYDTVARSARFEANRIGGAADSKMGRAASILSRQRMPPQTSGVVVAATSGAEGSTTRDDPADADGVSPETGGVAALREFQRLATTAVQKGMMDIRHAKVICAAFESGLSGQSGRLQELVHAAWGVYVTGGGEEDALDSLARIVHLAVKPFQVRPPAKTPPSFSPSGGTTERGASASTAELRESMSAAVKAIAMQSAQLLLQSKKVSAEEAFCLASPSPSGCQSILKALEKFDGGANRDVLLEAFATIAKIELVKRQGNEKQEHKEGDGDGEEGEEEEENDEKEDLDGGNDGADWQDQQILRRAEDEQGIYADRARMELMELADCMAGDKRIGVQEALLLATLIENKHPTVMHAYSLYASSQDVSALVSTLMAAVKTQAGGVVVPDATPAPNDKEGNRVLEELRAQGGRQPARERVVLLMHETRVLTATDATRLLLLLARQNPDTLAAFEAFDTSKDVSSLVDTIKLILEESPPIASTDLDVSMHQDGGRSKLSSLLQQILQPLPEATSRNADINAATETSRENEGDGSGGGSGGGRDGTNNDAVAESIVSIVGSMGLDETEAVALRLAIANGDSNMKGALELFRMDPDADELKDTVARVARLVMEHEREHETISADQERSATEAMGGDGDSRGAVSAGDTAADAAAAMARNMDFTLDGKAGLFEELLQQLGRAGVMGEAQAALIMDRYRKKDAVVFAALDVYKNESDMSELADTLKRLT
ncbi:unnamed protein product [Scytosiphon promiscuus]